VRRGVEFLALVELATQGHSACRRLLREAMLERAPYVLGAVGEEDKAGHPLCERGLQRGHDRLILSDPGAVEGIGHSEPRTVSGVGRDRAQRAGDTPIDEAVQVAAAEER
jgi:hypothetical protein